MKTVYTEYFFKETANIFYFAIVLKNANMFTVTYRININLINYYV